MPVTGQVNIIIIIIIIITAIKAQFVSVNCTVCYFLILW